MSAERGTGRLLSTSYNCFHRKGKLIKLERVLSPTLVLVVALCISFETLLNLNSRSVLSLRGLLSSRGMMIHTEICQSHVSPLLSTFCSCSLRSFIMLPLGPCTVAWQEVKKKNFKKNVEAFMFFVLQYLVKISANLRWWWWFLWEVAEVVLVIFCCYHWLYAYMLCKQLVI